MFFHHFFHSALFSYCFFAIFPILFCNFFQRHTAFDRIQVIPYVLIFCLPFLSVLTKTAQSAAVYPLTDHHLYGNIVLIMDNFVLAERNLNMRIKITSDSTCDLSSALLQKYDITLANLLVIKDGESYTDGISITPADIFAHVAAGGDLCSTAALGVGQYQDLFSLYASDYDAVVHISISSEFSSSYQNACIAAGEFDNVRVIDSRNLSTGQGLVVLAACDLRETVSSVDELCDRLNEFTGKVEASFLLSQLAYMVKGGRCSSATALGANLLNLKPCIEVRDGKMSVVKKYRGNFAKCLSSYVKDRLDSRDDLDGKRLFVTKTPVSDDCYQAVMNAVTEYGHFEEVYETDAGCTVSCHCGPGTLGVLFVRK